MLVILSFQCSKIRFILLFHDILESISLSSTVALIPPINRSSDISHVILQNSVICGSCIYGDSCILNRQASPMAALALPRTPSFPNMAINQEPRLLQQHSAVTYTKQYCSLLDAFDFNNEADQCKTESRVSNYFLIINS